MAWYLRLPLLVLIGSLPAAGVAQQVPTSFTSPNAQPDGAFGTAVGGLADGTGEGVAGVVVGAPDETGFFDRLGAGRAYLFNGADGTLQAELLSSNETADGRFGASIAGIGDVEGDGEADVVVGAAGEVDGAGRAYIYTSFDGSLLHELVSPNEESNGQFGQSVAGVPDVDGDGRADVLIGAPQEDPGLSPSGAGRAYLFSGADGSLIRPLVSPNEQQFGRFGIAVRAAGDVNNDGTTDLMVSAEQEGAGRAYVFSGVDGSVLHTLTPPDTEADGFGRAVSGLGDANGDGHADVLVGAEAGGGDAAGRVYLFSGLDGTVLAAVQSPNGVVGGAFGGSIVAVGDGNGDGKPDALIGAPGELVDGQHGAGRVYAFSGTNEVPYTTLTAPSPTDGGQFGSDVASAFHPDGAADPVVGAPGSGSNGAGRAYAFSRAVLPVELTTFTARQVEPGLITLSWTTASETNNAGFAVERRLVRPVERQAPFARIGFVPGMGTTTNPQQYRFRDATLPVDASTAAYRLMQVDRDGRATYSEVIEVAVGAPVEFALHGNAPNPFRHYTTLRYDIPRTGPVHLSLYDTRGRQVATLVDRVQVAGKKQLRIEGRRLASGVYVVRLKANGRVAHQRITVVR